jgi:hypothetical protein
MTDIVKVEDLFERVRERLTRGGDREGDYQLGCDVIDTIRAALSRTDAGGEIGEIASLAQQVLSIPWLRYSPDDGHSIVGSDLPDRLATLILQSPDSRGDVALREAATFLLWQYDRKGPIADSIEAWEALRAALSDDRRS